MVYWIPLFFIQHTNDKLRTKFKLRSITHPISHTRGRAIPDSKVHGAYMGPTWVLSAPDGPHVGPMNLAIGDALHITGILEQIEHVSTGLDIYQIQIWPPSCSSGMWHIYTYWHIYVRVNWVTIGLCNTLFPAWHKSVTNADLFNPSIGNKLQRTMNGDAIFPFFQENAF